MCKANKCTKDLLCTSTMYMVFLLLENNPFNSFGAVHRKKQMYLFWVYSVLQ